MNYIAVKVNANYNIETNKMMLSLTYMDKILQEISKEYLETHDGILTPKDEVIEKIKRHFIDDRRINKRKVKREVTNSVDSDEGEYSVLVGTVSLTDEGDIHNINHHTSYAFDGESPNYINVFLDRN